VAVVAKIAEKTGMPFRSIADAVLRGDTFAKLADVYNLKLQDVLDVKDEKMKIAAYEAAYQNTGKMGMGMMNSDMSMNGGMNNGSMSNGMSGGNMSSGNMSGGMTNSGNMSGGMMMNKDIVATAMGDKRFSTLVMLLKKAGLVETLQGAGPFTVFAPTNDAFKKLPKDALKNLENNPDQLKQVLLYHVIPAKVDAATAMAMTSPTSPPTVEGDTLQVTTSNGTVMVNNAKVVQADIMTTNGIIHAIDTVLMPSDMAMGAGAMNNGTMDNGAMAPAPPPAPAQ
ncbi:MAG: fasciclin domain-containing protein, partial [Armatimonadota bacterium]|nr:fasciclin domain-containing protein [Armatimonadota bacterium]